MTDYIPFAIQAEIMKRLPTKSLIQFRSVSKTWKALIDSSKFITDYRSQRHHLLVSYFQVDPNFISIVDDDTFPQHKVSMSPPLMEQCALPTVLGVSQGLFCLCPAIHIYPPQSLSSVVLWNPYIRKSVTIVVTNKMFGPGYQSVIGFGVRPDTSDLTLVKVNNYRRVSYQNTSTRTWEVEVYSLSSGAWRSISTVYRPSNSILISHGRHVAVDEFIYFIVVDRITFTTKVNWILSFDMTSEEMTRVSLPHSVTSAITNCYEVDISKVNGSLVVLATIEEASKRVFSVWMMERGGSNSFTKLFTVNPPDASVSASRLLGFRKNSEPIFLARNSEEVNDIFVHEHNNNKFVWINGEAFPYMETLLLLDH